MERDWNGTGTRTGTGVNRALLLAASVCNWYCRTSCRHSTELAGVLLVSAWVKYLIVLLQTHHACTHARAHTRTRAHARVRTHTRALMHTHTDVAAVAAVAVRRTDHRYSVSPNRGGPLRLLQFRSLAIQISTRTGDPNTPIFLMFFAYKNIARPN